MNRTLILLILLLCACSKPVRYSKEDLYAKAKAADDSTALILPKSMNEGISCRDYTPGCLGAHIVQINKLDFIAVEFNSEAEAIYAAKKMRGYYVRNWLLDDVTGEPWLEKFVSNSLEAKKP